MPAQLYQPKLTLDLWHRRLGHLGLRNVKATEKITTGIAFKPDNCSTATPNLCESCELSKPLRHVRKSVSSRPRKPLDSVSVDVVMIKPAGKILMNDSWISVRYCTMFTDGATSARWGYYHNDKSDATEAIKYFNVLMSTQYNAVVKSWRLDGGKEYSPRMMGNLAAKLGQIIETTTPYFPEQDGRAERSIGIIISRVRTAAIEMNIPKFLWPELVRSQLQIANRTATSVLEGETPIQAFNRLITGIDEKPDLSHLRVLGCKVYVQIPIEKRIISQKLDKRAEIGILVGYDGQHIYRVYIPSRQRVIRSSVVQFDEDNCISSSSTENEFWEPNDYIPNNIIQVDESRGEELNTLNQHEPSQNILTPFEQLSFDEHQRDVRPEVTQAESRAVHDDENLLGLEALPHTDSLSGENSPFENIEELPETTVTRRGRPPGSKNKVYQKVNRNTRSTAASSTQDQRTAFLSFITASQSLFVVDENSDPKTLAEAMSSKDSGSWKLAIDREYRSLAMKKTWSLVRRSELPRGTKVLTGKLVLKTKRGKEGEILKHKARWVVRGFEQEYGRDYTQTYAGVCRNTTWKIAIALAAKFDLEIEQMDAVTAFLNSDADNDIYVEVPPGWIEPGISSNFSFVCKLEKALYGLKQAPRLWQKHLRSCLAEVGFEPLASDHCLYLNKQTKIIIVTYVDDFLIIGKNIGLINSLKEKLAHKFQLEDLGPACYFLGVRITRDRPKKRIYLTQDAYARQILERFCLENCRPADTPIAAGFDVFLVPNDGAATAAQIKEYQSKVGSLLYLAVHTRPDIAFACSSFSRYLSNPSLQHLKGLDRIFRYIRGTINLGIMYDGNSPTQQLHGYCDSDWGGDKGTRRSTGGSLFFLAAGVISASAKSQPNVALSSTEAEYYAYTSCIQELLWIQQIMAQMLYSGKDIVSTRIYTDNQSSLALGNNPELHSRTKHIDVKHHFIREHLDAGRVDARYISTHEMAADGLTKSLSANKHSKFI
ncbi:Copia protein, partial [Podosphaera aphanis]